MIEGIIITCIIIIISMVVGSILMYLTCLTTSSNVLDNITITETNDYYSEIINDVVNNKDLTYLFRAILLLTLTIGYFMTLPFYALDMALLGSYITLKRLKPLFIKRK